MDEIDDIIKYLQSQGETVKAAKLQRFVSAAGSLKHELKDALIMTDEGTVTNLCYTEVIKTATEAGI